MTFEPEDVFVIGGAGPFPLAVAGELVGRGFSVLLVGPELEPLEEAVAELGERAFPCVVDLADPADAERVGGVAAALLGRVDGVLVEAPVPAEGDLLGVPDADWHAAFKLAVRMPLGLVRGIAPLLEGEGGAILFVTPTPQPDEPGVVQAGVTALLDALTRTVGPAIRVNRIDPDPERVHMAADLLSGAATQ